jgi:hypothetical protein
VHLHLDHAVALAGFAAAALDVEAETAGLVAARTRFRHLRKQLAHGGEQPGVRGRIGARRAPDRALVDVDHLVEQVQALDRLMRRRLRGRAVQLHRGAMLDTACRWSASTCPSRKRRWRQIKSPARGISTLDVLQVVAAVRRWWPAPEGSSGRPACGALQVRQSSASAPGICRSAIRCWPAPARTYIQKAVTPLFIIFFKEAKFLLNKIYRKKLKDIYKFDLFKNNYKFTFFGKNYDFQYFKFKKKQKEYRINNKRFTTLVYELTNLEDTRKSNTAYIANIIHALDSHFLRSIYETCHERNIYIHTIHDEFIVPVENYFEILEIANSIYSDMFNTLNKNSKKKYSSYFMFI